MVSIVDNAVFDQTMTNIRSGKDSTSYLLCGHVTFTDYKTIHVVRYGRPPGGTLKDLRDHLDPGQVMYALLRIPIDGRVRYVYVHWIGCRVLASKRFRYEDVHGDIVKYFGNFDTEILVHTPDELNDENIRDQVLNQQSQNNNDITKT